MQANSVETWIIIAAMVVGFVMLILLTLILWKVFLKYSLFSLPIMHFFRWDSSNGKQKGN